MKVMIVDDNLSIREMVRDTLTPGVDHFADCGNGIDAVAMYKVFHPDWVVMDIMMNVMDGLEATEKILADDPQAKIIILTQHEEPRLREKARRIGAVEFVLKEHLEDIERIIIGQSN